MLLFLMVMHPTYRLELIKGLIKDGSWYITGSAVLTAGELGFESDEIRDCIVNHLSETHFFKTMASEQRPGLMQDVYHITYEGIRLYVKLQVSGDAVVVSFKEL